MNGWWILVAIFYPITTFGFPWVNIEWPTKQFTALFVALVVALVLWLEALPRDLAWTFPIDIAPRFAVPLTAYLAGLVVAMVLMHWATEKRS